MRRGQAMLETLVAVVFVTFVFLVLFQVSHMLTARILLDHAAARAARARAVGFNDFMCRKSARVAMIPVAGRRTWPTDGEFDEVARMPIYMCTENESLARGVLEYERWDTMSLCVRSGGGLSAEADATVGIDIPRFFAVGDRDGDIAMEGAAALESHFPLYMNDQGR